MSRPQIRAAESRVLVFGESKNDADSIRELVLHINPRLDGRVHARPRPVSLVSGSGPAAVRRWLDHLEQVVEAERRTGRLIQAVLVHRDADRQDPRGEVEAALAREVRTIDGARPVVPVQMIEAWWFLFPAAVEAVRPVAWRGKLSITPGDVERIDQPKKKLERLTRGSRPYSEADSAAIAAQIRDQRRAPRGSSASYERFVAMARGLE
ncbi:MAG: hypothetical protein ACRCY9_12740 [Phycicoccus sp.]